MDCHGCNYSNAIVERLPRKALSRWPEVYPFKFLCVYHIWTKWTNTSYSRYASYLPFQIRYSAVTRQITIMGHKGMGWKNLWIMSHPNLPSRC